MFPLHENEFVMNILIASIAGVLNNFFSTLLALIFGLPTS
jgi:hypothetical protein